MAAIVLFGNLYIFVIFLTAIDKCNLHHVIKDRSFPGWSSGQGLVLRTCLYEETLRKVHIEGIELQTREKQSKFVFFKSPQFQLICISNLSIDK